MPLLFRFIHITKLVVIHWSRIKNKIFDREPNTDVCRSHAASRLRRNWILHKRDIGSSRSQNLPQKLENVQSIDYIDMDEAKYSSFSSRKADRSYRLLEKEVWFLTSVIFLSLNHFSRLSSRMAGKQGRMQSLPFKLRFPCTRNVVWPADRSIAMLWPSRMDRNDNDTLGELLVSRPSKKRESLLLADIRIDIGRRIVF